MDLLAGINPGAAAAYAQHALATPSDPDEWAVSLRNYALGGPLSSTQAYLQGKFREMLSNDSWRSNPSVGYLEAFDTAVYTHDTALAPVFSGMIRNTATGQQAVTHAAYLAMDRLVIEDPVNVLSQLESQPGLMQGRELTRANYFARADTGDPAQKALLEQYLLDQTRTPAELNSFAAIYPNENFMLSNNLLSQTQTPSSGQIAARDRQALATVQEWLGDPRFQQLTPQLHAIQARLQAFVQQENSPPR